MDAALRDSTEDWVLPEDSTPPLLGELEERIEEALSTARASEAAVMTVGAAALDAAEQARRAAKIAERAAATALDVQFRAGRGTVRSAGPAAGLEDESLRSFTERANRVIRRLRKLEQLPRRYPSASAPAGP
jgi:hypothetical protein